MRTNSNMVIPVGREVSCGLQAKGTRDRALMAASCAAPPVATHAGAADCRASGMSAAAAAGARAQQTAYAINNDGVIVGYMID